MMVLNISKARMMVLNMSKAAMMLVYISKAAMMPMNKQQAAAKKQASGQPSEQASRRKSSRNLQMPIGQNRGQ